MIEACYEMFDLRRAQEWTAALSQWCASQPDLVPYRGQCLVRRAEIMQLHGAWPDAMDGSASARANGSDGTRRQPAVGTAFYQLAELHRLRGEFAKAEEAYRAGQHLGPRAAARAGAAAAGAGTDRGAAGRPSAAWWTKRPSAGRASRMLAAYVEIMLAAQRRREARARRAMSCRRSRSSSKPRSCAPSRTQAPAPCLLAEGDARAALGPLRSAWTAWQELDAPYDAARRPGAHRRAPAATLGDDDSAEMELDAARQVFQYAGRRAGPGRVREHPVARRWRQDTVGGLTAREIEVLGLVATGKTNRAIADELAISEKTVARHLSNIFTKLDLSSRAAATAYAYQHQLV